VQCKRVDILGLQNTDRTGNGHEEKLKKGVTSLLYFSRSVRDIPIKKYWTGEDEKDKRLQSTIPKPLIISSIQTQLPVKGEKQRN
jgi:hypothetical protein